MGQAVFLDEETTLKIFPWLKLLFWEPLQEQLVRFLPSSPFDSALAMQYLWSNKDCYPFYFQPDIIGHPPRNWHQPVLNQIANICALGRSIRAPKVGHLHQYIFLGNIIAGLILIRFWRGPETGRGFIEINISVIWDAAQCLIIGLGCVKVMGH